MHNNGREVNTITTLYRYWKNTDATLHKWVTIFTNQYNLKCVLVQCLSQN